MNHPSSALSLLIADEHLDRPFIAAGERAYLVGSQDGSFPDRGWHVKGEMGGIWAHPIKLLDGFWLRLDGTWLTEAHRFRVGPYWSEHEYQLGDLRVVRQEMALDEEAAVVVRYTMESPGARTVSARFLARSDIRDVWSPHPAGAEATAPDAATLESDRGIWRCAGASGLGTVVLGSCSREPVGNESGHDLWGPETTAGRGVSVALDYEIQLAPGTPATLELVIVGAEGDSDNALATYRRVCARLPDLQRAKEQRYETVLTRSALEIPDASIMRAWNWIKCDYEWLVRAAEPWGRGLGAGVDDYPWWFGCDNAYALRGCLALGQHDIATYTLDLLQKLSEKANGPTGRVIHEANTRGLATDLGRTEETPHFVRAVWDTFLWTGDVSFLERVYPFCKHGLLDWTLGEQSLEGDLRPYGYGVMETWRLDLQCVDTASLTIEALAGLAGMADILGEPEVAERCRSLHDRAVAQLDAFWMESEGMFGDMLATPGEMVPRLREWMDHAATRNPLAAERFGRLLAEAESSTEPARKRPWLLKHWSVLCPIEAGLADEEKALRALRRAEGPEFSGPWGVYIQGIYGDAMMSIATSVLAVAEATYGRSEEALTYIRTLTDTLEMQMPGAISEMSPDYGCFVQAWSGYGVAWPVVTGIFGIQPDAHHRHIELAPHFPPDWRDARLHNIRIGTNSIDVYWDGETLWVTSREPGWQITCDSLPLRLAQHSAPPASFVEPE